MLFGHEKVLPPPYIIYSLAFTIKLMQTISLLPSYALSPFCSLNEVDTTSMTSTEKSLPHPAEMLVGLTAGLCFCELRGGEPVEGLVQHDPNVADTVPYITLMWLDMCAAVSKFPVPVREGECDSFNGLSPGDDPFAVGVDEACRPVRSDGLQISERSVRFSLQETIPASQDMVEVDQSSSEDVIPF
jgi:hypothetical protein